VKAKQHMAFEDTGSFQPLLGEALQMRPRPSEENGIDRVDLEERVFPFDQPIERGPRGLGQMKKDNRLRGVRGCHHEKADDALLMLNETLFPHYSQRK